LILNIHIINKCLGFGNYVTCKWWDDLWLNEAMATWLSYKPFGTHYPDWNMVEYIFFFMIDSYFGL
jgi:aminopeptidase N